MNYMEAPSASDLACASYLAIPGTAAIP